MQVMLWKPQPDFIRDLIRHPACDSATSKACLRDISRVDVPVMGTMELTETGAETVDAGDETCEGIVPQV